MARLKVAALIGGEPGPHELWSLREMASGDCELRVLEAPPAAVPTEWSLDGEGGPLRALSRSISARLAVMDRPILEELFDFDDLRAWWCGSGITPERARTLHHESARAALAAMAPDVIVRVSGDMPGPDVLSLARLAALNIHHGWAPLIRGPWSIPWAILEERHDWIGATVHLIGGEAGAGPILWRGAPQLAPGDTDLDLFFRAHLQASRALARILKAYASGEAPEPHPRAAGETSTYRPSAGLRDWLKLLRLERGRRARVLLERGLEC